MRGGFMLYCDKCWIADIKQFGTGRINDGQFSNEFRQKLGIMES
jgi:hypothetical protein